MEEAKKKFDVIIIGSGTCGSVIAKELANQGRNVLILEQGQNVPIKETFWGVATIANEVKVTDKLKDLRAIVAGGTTSLYMGVVEPPPIDAYKGMGIDLENVYKDVQNEIPIDELPDELLGDQAIRLRKSAVELGYKWEKKPMLIDQSKCDVGYSFDAKWKAKSFLDESVEKGAAIICKAKAYKVIVEKNKAVGVEYTQFNGLFKKTYKVYGEKIVVAAGALSTPLILRESGVKNVVSNGYCIDPSLAILGIVDDLNGVDNFAGSMGAKINNEISFIDANLNKFLFRLGMIAKMRLIRAGLYHKSIGISVKVKDSMGGELRQNGQFYKQLTSRDLENLKKGEESAIEILKNAGAKNFYNLGIMTGGMRGLLKIGEHINNNLESDIQNLFVCDSSILPDDISITPTLTLICLAKYLSGKL